MSLSFWPSWSADVTLYLGAPTIPLAVNCSWHGHDRDHYRPFYWECSHDAGEREDMTVWTEGPCLCGHRCVHQHSWSCICCRHKTPNVPHTGEGWPAYGSESLAGECLVFTMASSCDFTVELLSFLDSQVMAEIECLLAVLLSSTVPVLITVPHHVCDCMNR